MTATEPERWSEEAERLRHMEAVVENMPVMLAALDEAGHIVRWNRECEQVTGYAAAEVLGNPRAMDLLDPGHEGGGLRAVWARHGTERADWVLTAKDGMRKTTAWFKVSGRHSVPGWAAWGVGVDVTSHRQVRVELEGRALQQKAVADLGWRALAGGDLDAILQEATERLAATLAVEYCKVLELLPGGEELRLRAGTGWREGLIGCGVVDAGADSQAGYTLLTSEPVIVADLRTEKRFSGPPLLREHGVVSGMSVIIRGEDRPFGILGVHTRDRRSFTQDDIHFLQAVANLIATAIQREQSTRELGAREEQLRQAQKMEAVGRLAGGIAHDFNNLLVAIQGYASLARRRLADGDPAAEYLGQIQLAGDRAAALTRQLLAFSRKQVLQPRVVEVNAVVADVEKMLKRVIGEDVELSTRLDPDAGRISADTSQFQQVLMNLAVNARDAMAEGGRLEIRTGRTDDHVVIEVSDTGHGMDEQTLAQAFEPFFTTKESGKGTGLGLSTVYGIVKQSGGEISCRSRVGAGTTVRIELPRVDAAVGEPRGHPAQEPRLVGDETILVAEDDDAVRRLVTTTLESYGYTVLAARDGEEALRLFESHEGPIELLITDVVMPRMGGQDLAEGARRLRQGIKVLYVTGYTDRPLELPEDAVLLKPYRPEALVRKVRRLLG